MSSGYKFPILNSDGTTSTTVVDMEDMFIKKDLWMENKLWAWGYNNYGQLGNGYTIYYSSPIQIGLLNGWKWVGNGNGAYGRNANFCLATKTDGTLWTWGSGTYGVLLRYLVLGGWVIWNLAEKIIKPSHL